MKINDLISSIKKNKPESFVILVASCIFSAIVSFPLAFFASSLESKLFRILIFSTAIIIILISFISMIYYILWQIGFIKNND